jgi:predicted O-methyltransferase YrrM
MMQDQNIFWRIAQEANGLLPPQVYEKLYDAAHTAPPGAFVEIGTAHGAATIALALGAKASRKSFHIFTADPFEGRFSSRARFGSVPTNVAIVKENFRKFGVEDCISIVIGTSLDLVRNHQLTDISLLMLDADGCIDRDFAILFDSLAEDAHIIIDDLNGAAWTWQLPDGTTVFDQKCKLAKLLVESFEARGLLERTDFMCNTGFFRKGIAESSEISAAALPAYRELVFTEYAPSKSAPPRLRSLLAARFPKAANLYKRVRGRLS